MPQLPVVGSGSLPTSLVVSGRTVPVLLPNNYNGRLANGQPVKRYRLALFLHSYGGNATSCLNRYFASSAEARNAGGGTICLLPTGLTDTLGNPCWNSADPCCANDFVGPPNDVTFLTDLIIAAKAAYAIDPNQVDVYGYSNGAIMAYTLALCSPQHVTNVWTFAGFSALPGDSHYCGSSGLKVHVTHVTPMADLVILPGGDGTGVVLTDKPTGAYASRLESVNNFAARNGCTGTLGSYDTADLTAATAGAETTRYSYPGQAVNGSVELWEVGGVLADHNVGMSTGFLRAVELRNYQTRRV